MINWFRRRAESAPPARRLRIAKLQKQAFGASSEKIGREIEQLELALEGLLVAAAESDDGPIGEGEDEPTVSTADTPARKPRRRPRVSDTTPRERRELDPGHDCPDCGGDLWVVGEDVSEALDRIGKLYDIEREITGQSADARLAARQKLSKPKVDAFKHWAEQQLTRIPGKGDLAKVFRYGLSRWPSFCRFLEDGRVAIDNNAAERAMRPIGIGRKTGYLRVPIPGPKPARAMTLVETAKLNGLDPQAYLADVLDRIHDHKINCIDELLPWNWAPASAVSDQAA